MKITVIAFGFLVSTAAFGNGLAEMIETDRCASWVSNAMYGATQSMRGASRDVEFISRRNLVEILAPAAGAGSDKLYILADEGRTEHERGFIEKSILFGYDAMSSWKSRNAGLMPKRDEWQRHFMAMCVEHAAI